MEREQEHEKWIFRLVNGKEARAGLSKAQRRAPFVSDKMTPSLTALLLSPSIQKSRKQLVVCNRGPNGFINEVY